MTKKIINKIKRECKKFHLIAEEINHNTLKVYSTKYVFDTWLIKIENNKVNLYHNSKKFNNKKCSYHLQNSYNLKYWYWSLQQIDSHNRFIINRKHYKNTDWIGDLLKKHNQKIHNICPS